MFSEFSLPFGLQNKDYHINVTLNSN